MNMHWIWTQNPIPEHQQTFYIGKKTMPDIKLKNLPQCKQTWLCCGVLSFLVIDD